MIFVFNIFSLHLKLIRFRKKLIYDFVQLLQRHLPPLPRIAVVPKVFPRSFLWPAFKARVVVVLSNEWDLSNDRLVLLQSTHYSLQLISCDALFVFVVFAIERLDLILFPFD